MKALAPKVYATIRFASSSFAQFESVYESYEALASVFSMIRETDDNEEEMKYQVKGRDFCFDLCGVTDALGKLMEMMTKSQSLHQFIWSITKWWPKLKAILNLMKSKVEEQQFADDVVLPEQLFLKLNKHFSDLTKEEAEDCVFKGIELLPGWMVTDQRQEIDEAPNRRKKRKVIEWVERSPNDCMNELILLCDTIVTRMDSRFAASVTEAAFVLGNCLHVPDILSLLQGKSKRFTSLQHASLNVYGKEEFGRFYRYVCSLSHIKKLADKEPELNLHHSFSESVHKSYKDVVFRVVWEDFSGCRNLWFPPIKGFHGQGELKEFNVILENSEIEEIYKFIYEDKVCTTRLDYPSVFATLYTNEEMYSFVGREMCIAIDIAMAMSGSEAVVESYYSVMKSQKKDGGQNNKTLVERTNVDWCFPNPLQCQETINEVAALYLDGDAEVGLPKHQVPIFLDDRGRYLNKYMHGSKVLDRLAAPSDHFILCEKDKTQ